MRRRRGSPRCSVDHRRSRASSPNAQLATRQSFQLHAPTTAPTTSNQLPITASSAPSLKTNCNPQRFDPTPTTTALTRNSGPWMDRGRANGDNASRRPRPKTTAPRTLLAWAIHRAGNNTTATTCMCMAPARAMPASNGRSPLSTRKTAATTQKMRTLSRPPWWLVTQMAAMAVPWMAAARHASSSVPPRRRTIVRINATRPTSALSGRTLKTSSNGASSHVDRLAARPAHSADTGDCRNGGPAS